MNILQESFKVGDKHYIQVSALDLEDLLEAFIVDIFGNHWEALLFICTRHYLLF